MTEKKEPKIVKIDLSFVKEYVLHSKLSPKNAYRHIGELLMSISDTYEELAEKPGVFWYSAHCHGKWNTGEEHTWWSPLYASEAPAFQDWSAHVANEPDATHELYWLIIEPPIIDDAILNKT